MPFKILKAYAFIKEVQLAVKIEQISLLEVAGNADFDVSLLSAHFMTALAVIVYLRFTNAFKQSFPKESHEFNLI